MRNVLTKNCGAYFSTVLFILTLLPPPRLGPPQEAGQRTGGGQGDWRGLYAAMFGDAFQRKVSDASENWRVSLTGWKTCPEAVSGQCFFFRIERRDGGTSSDVRLANETAQVDAISITSASQAAILGRAMHNMYVVTLLLLPSGTQLDRFLCQWPALSPDRHFVAYDKFSPAHPGYQYSPSAEYLVYDLRASVEDNRTPTQARPLQPYDVGWPVYPEGVKNVSGDNMFEGRDVPVHWMASEGFFWLGAADTVAFVDRWQGVSSLVVADVSGGIQRPRVHAYPIEAARVVDLPGCKSKVAPSDFEAWSKDPSVLIHVTDIQVSSQNPRFVRLKFSPHPCLASTVLDVALNSPGGD